MRFSVIIPVYNAEKTLRRCLDSLLEQACPSVEIILVNDGSGDGSAAICKSYAEKFDCIRYHEKENGGVSSARNVGLRHAHGDYYLFVDSDDYVSKDYFSVIDHTIETNRPDLILFSSATVGAESDTQLHSDRFVSDPGQITGIIIDCIKKHELGAPWSKVYSAEIIRQNELHFLPELSIAEDLAFVFSYALHVKSLATLSDVLYYNCVENQNSLSRKRRDYLSEHLYKATLAQMDALDHSVLPNDCRKQYDNMLTELFYRSVYSCSKELLKHDLTLPQRLKKIRGICKEYSNPRRKLTSLRAALLGIPVRLRLALLIDAAAKRASRLSNYF